MRWGRGRVNSQCSVVQRWGWELRGQLNFKKPLKQVTGQAGTEHAQEGAARPGLIPLSSWAAGQDCLSGSFISAPSEELRTLTPRIAWGAARVQLRLWTDGM